MGKKNSNNDPAISSYRSQIEQYGFPINDGDFKTLRSYADERGIKLSGFKDYIGSIDVIKTVIDDICEISLDFPEIIDDRHGIRLENDYNLGTDFATTESGHIIHLNAVYFSDLPMLKKDYAEGVAECRFVKGTDWRAISRHETGHVVTHIYKIDPMKVAKKVFSTDNKAEVLYRVGNELSLYSAEFEDGREIVSESFSGYYGGTGNIVAAKVVKHCLDISKERR